MPSGMINFNIQDCIDDLNKMGDDAKKVIQSTMNDIRNENRGMAWIRKGIRTRYNISASDLKGNKVGKTRIKGDDLGELSFTFSGRRLTPSHFGMQPKSPKGTYSLRAEILKGGRKRIGEKKALTKKQKTNIGRNFTRQGTRNSPSSPYMLMSTGNKQPGGTDYIPFRRESQPGKFKKVLRTIAYPQMITKGKDGAMRQEIAEVFNEGVEKRFNHYLDRYLTK